jgi:hypothetical protein
MREQSKQQSNLTNQAAERASDSQDRDDTTSNEEEATQQQRKIKEILQSFFGASPNAESKPINTMRTEDSAETGILKEISPSEYVRSFRQTSGE